MKVLRILVVVAVVTSLVNSTSITQAAEQPNSYYAQKANQLLTVKPFVSEPQSDAKSLVLDIAVDADQDGMLDEWENNNGLNPNDASDASADNDNDSYSNIKEFYAKTNPQNNSSYPQPVATVSFENGLSPFFWEVNSDEMAFDRTRASQGNTSLKFSSADSLSRICFAVYAESDGFIAFDALTVVNTKSAYFLQKNLSGESIRNRLESSSFTRFIYPLAKGGNNLCWAIQSDVVGKHGNSTLPLSNENAIWIDNISITALPETDSDNDKVPDAWELTFLRALDTSLNEDFDNDGLTNQQEYELGTHPHRSDTDGDQIPDGWEQQHGLNPLNADDALLDPDNDGFNTLEEYFSGTNHQDSTAFPVGTLVGFEASELTPFAWVMNAENIWELDDKVRASGFKSLSSGDVSDGASVVEVTVESSGGFVRFDLKIDTLLPGEHLSFSVGYNKYYLGSTNGQFRTVYAPLPKGMQTLTWRIGEKAGKAWIDNVFITADPNVDSDSDGIKDSWELGYFNSLNTAMADDSDGDGLSNQQEYDLGTNPINIDSDRDGLSDAWEHRNGFNPLQSVDAALDSDGDGFSALQEFWAQTDINDPASRPSITHISFENGTLSPFHWKLKTLKKPWFVSNVASSDGNKSLASSNITNIRDELDPGHSEIEVSVYSTGGFIEFDALSESKKCCSFLAFNINDRRVWSGSPSSFKKVAFQLPKGIQKLTWRVYGSSGKIYIDNIKVTADPNYDSDNDGIADSWEYSYFGNLSQNMSEDLDSDGLTNQQEWELGTNPVHVDSDSDGIHDNVEVDNGLNPLLASDASLDFDNDGFINRYEVWAGTDINDSGSKPQGTLVNFESQKLKPFYWFESGGSFDGTFKSEGNFSYKFRETRGRESAKLSFSVFMEKAGYLKFDIATLSLLERPSKIVFQGGSTYKTIASNDFEIIAVPLKAGVNHFSWTLSGIDSDGETHQGTGLNQGWLDNLFITTTPDVDNDSIEDSWELKFFNNLTTDLSLDHDNDGLTSFEEYNAGTNPNSPDSDGDQISDGWEINNGLNPLDVNDGEQDLDNDGYSNLQEFFAGTELNDAASVPAVQTVNFENNNLGPLYWKQSGLSGWNIAKEGATTNHHLISKGWLKNQDAKQLETHVHSTGGFVSFDYNVGTAYSMDALKFYINDELKTTISYGYTTKNSGKLSFKLPVGKYRLKWSIESRDSILYIPKEHSVVLDNIVVTGSPATDSDSDNIFDDWELLHFNNLDADLNQDFDSDGLNGQQEFTHRADPNRADTDFDKMPDGWESIYNFNLEVNDAGVDSDSDNFANIDEYFGGTRPTDSQSFPKGTLVDFEQSTIKPFYWVMEDLPWILSKSHASQGERALRSGIKQYSTSSTKVSLFSEGGYVRFDLRSNMAPSSQNVSFYIDNVPKLTVDKYNSGDDFETYYFKLPKGFHILKWKYESGYSTNDTYGAWLDNIFVTASPDYDSDNDGVADDWEMTYFNNLDADMSADADQDGLSNFQEFQLGTSPVLSDTDSDGLDDLWESQNNFNPLDPSDASADNDGDGFSNLEEVFAQTSLTDANDIPQGTLITFDEKKRSSIYIYLESTTRSKVVKGNELFLDDYDYPSININSSGGFLKFDYLAEVYSPYYIPLLYINGDVVFGFGPTQEWKTAIIKMPVGKAHFTFDFPTYSSLKLKNIFITAVSDSDNDSADDSWEYTFFGNLDSDLSLDADNDGLSNLDESLSQTDPRKVDTDNDGMDDNWEVIQDLKPLDMSDASDDIDQDGFANILEYWAGTDIKDASSKPTGTLVDFESNSFAPLYKKYLGAAWLISSKEPISGRYSIVSASKSSDGSNKTEFETYVYSNGGYVSFDSKGFYYNDSIDIYIDGQKQTFIAKLGDKRKGFKLTPGGHRLKWSVSPLKKRIVDNIFITNVVNKDEDEDGISDSWEQLYFGSLDVDMLQDPDNDGLTNQQEYELRTNPSNLDSDGDGMPDGWEVSYGLNPNDTSDASLDLDSDGFINSLEFALNSKPNDVNSKPVGTYVDFEDAEITPLDWIMGRDPWVLDRATPLKGSNSLRSASITHNQKSETKVLVNSVGGKVYFDYKVSSESNRGYLKFYIDGALQSSWSGTEVGFAFYELPKGRHEIKWVYEKDRRGSRGVDAAWIDNIFVSAPAIYDDIPPPKVTPKITTSDSGTSVFLDWRSYDESADGGGIKEYLIYQLSNAFSNTEQATLVTTVAAPYKQARIEGLTRNQTYYFAVVAVDISGNKLQVVESQPVTPVDTLGPHIPYIESITSSGNSIRIKWRAVSATDLAGYKLRLIGGDILDFPVTSTEYELINLLPNKGYQFELTAYDQTGNSSIDVTRMTATHYENPLISSINELSGKVNLLWDAPADIDGIYAFNIYQSDSPFSSVKDMKPVIQVAHSKTSASIAQLTNGKTYYFAVAIENLNNEIQESVVSKSATPSLDNRGPELSDIQWSGKPLVDGLIVDASGTLSTKATDESGVSRVEFYLAGNLLGASFGEGGVYNANLNIQSVTNGTQMLTIKAYDTLDKFTEVSKSITIQLALPNAPTIEKPVTNSTTNQKQLEVVGTSNGKSVQLYRNGSVASDWVTVVDNRYRGFIELADGNNQVTAKAKNRSGESPTSTPVVVTLDLSVPEAPTGLIATSKSQGKVQLSWNASSGDKVAGYDVYRASEAFIDLSQATRINNKHLTKTSFDDLPSTDGVYYYRVVAVNALETPSGLSNQVQATADSIAPTAKLSYQPLGKYDATLNMYGRGEIQINVELSEPLLTVPFVSIKPATAELQMLNLQKVSELEYTAKIMIDAANQSGATIATFSGKDNVGNQGTEIIEGASINIDSAGPSIISIETSPQHPIQNLETDPVKVFTNFTLDGAVKGGTTPSIHYVLSGVGRVETALSDLRLIEGNKWQGSFTLPTDAGLSDAELLSFKYQAVDALDNESTLIKDAKNIQVYQGDLPPLETPFGLQAKAKADGRIELTWYKVSEAVGYQIYRKSPLEAELTEFMRLENGLQESVIDPTTVDGDYEYAIASIRNNNGQERLSARGQVVKVTADSAKPNGATGLTLELTPVGIEANWTLSDSADISHYELYRASTQPITSLDGLEPIIERIPATSPSVVDQAPVPALPAYVVVAVDSAGNRSELSNTAYLNVDLFPVATLNVEQRLDNKPTVSWTHDNSNLSGFDLYLGDKATGYKVNQSLIIEKQYVDSGYANDTRQYTVIAKDANNVESLARSIVLPKLSIALKEGELIKTNLINELEFVVTNHSNSDLINSRLNVALAGKEHLSESFNLAANSTKTIPVVVGGYAGLATASDYEVSFISRKTQTEAVTIVRKGNVQVLPGALNLSLETKDMLRGGSGKVRFSVENSGEVLMELITALGRGNSNSADIRLLLKDLDGNVLSTKTFKQATGSTVLTLTSGQTVARIDAGATWQSNWFDMSIPTAAPDQVQLELQIDNIYRNVGLPEMVKLKGTNTTSAVSLFDTPYTGGSVTVSPEASFGDQDISIQGKALERETQQPVPNAAIKLIIAVNGFEKTASLTTDEQGTFTYLYKPENNEAGTYTVSAIHPELTERPDHGVFVINDVAIRPSTLNVRIPKRYTQELPITITSGEGTQLNNVRFALRAIDQPKGNLPQDISMDFGSPVNLASGERKRITLKMTAGDDALKEGSFTLALLSDESGEKAVSKATVKYILTEAQPSLYYSPSLVETGVSLTGQVSESLQLQNKGVDTLRDVNLELLRLDGFAAPSWVTLNVSSKLGDINVGETKELMITATPQNQAAPGVYELKLRVSSSNHPVRDIPVFISVTESGVGGYQFKVSDMYTATLDANGNLIQGLKGATVRLQNEDVPSIEYSLLTNELGEVLFENVPAGRYSYWVTAQKHLEKHGRVTVRPSVTRNENVFLDYQLITLEWSVNEITIEDRYEIVLSATYEVDVPAAVVVLAPSSMTMPEMKPGDVFYGELTLTNHGLIRADKVKYTLPQSDQYYKFEILESALPDSLEAKAVKRIPYRITALQSLEPEVNGSGGGCYTYRNCMDTEASFECANGDESSSSSTSCWTESYGTCNTSGGGGGAGGWFGGGGGDGGGVWGTGSVPQQKPMPPCASDSKDCAADGNDAGDQ